MGRKRVIDQEHILDAAEAVVARLGASKLTLDAVAAEMDISKASVIYDYKTKQALIEAVVQRAVRRDNAFNQTITDGLGDVPNKAIRGRILAAAEPLPDEFQAVALNLCAALAQDERLRKSIQDNQSAVIHSITQSSPNPRGGLLAYLALEGLKLLESLDYHHWPKAERDQILRDIEWLAQQTPPE